MYSDSANPPVYVTQGRAEAEIPKPLRPAAMTYSDSVLNEISQYVAVSRVSDDYAPSVAILDWTTVNNVRSLLLRDQVSPQGIDAADPFIAVADLSTLIAAAIFYDHILVFDAEEIIYDVGDWFGVGDAIYTRSSTSQRSVSGSDIIADVFDDCFNEASGFMANLRNSEQFHTDLKGAWKALFPSARFPSTYNVNQIGWSSTPGSPTNHLQLFVGDGTLEWQMYGIEGIIIENNTRALTYEKLARTLTGAVSDRNASILGSMDYAPSFRYVGGVLRSPMQRALRGADQRAWDPRGGNPAEQALNSWWLTQEDIQCSAWFPFWLPMVIADVKSKSELGRVVRKWRHRAKDFRAHRSQLECALLSGNPQELEQYRIGMANAIERLTEGVTVSASLSAASGAAGPGLELSGMPPLMSDACAAVVEQEAQRLLKPATSWLLRCTRPRLWFLATANKFASRMRSPQYRLNELFGLPAGDKATVAKFFANANSIQWSM